MLKMLRDMAHQRRICAKLTKALSRMVELRVRLCIGSGASGCNDGGKMQAELTIVIPAKNECEMLPKLLNSLCQQDYEGMGQTRVIVADAGSTDGDG